MTMPPKIIPRPPIGLSPKRAVLCSAVHAYRVARRMVGAGIAVTVVPTLDPIQPWRVIETGEGLPDRENAACG